MESNELKCFGTQIYLAILTVLKYLKLSIKSLMHFSKHLFALKTDKAVYFVTERVQLLSTYLRDSQDNESQKENEVSWGLHQVAVS